MTEGSYYSGGPIHARDSYRAAAAFAAAAEANPGDLAALNNSAVVYASLGNAARAESLYRQPAQVGAAPSLNRDANLAELLRAQGRFAAADSALARLARGFPNSPKVPAGRAYLEYARGHADSAEAIAREAYGRWRDAAHPEFAAFLANLALLKGRVREADRLSAEAWSGWGRQGVVAASFGRALEAAWRDLWLLDAREHAVRVADSVLASGRLDTLPLADRPYQLLMGIYAAAGRPDRARVLLADYERQVSGATDTLIASDRHFALGVLAHAERRYADAAREIRVAGALDICGGCTMASALGNVYDLANNPDSAIAMYTRYVESPATRNIANDAIFLAGTHKRLGELWEAKGDVRKAAHHYAKFVELWKNADPELQPRVREVRQRLERLSRLETR
jgi:tetratricopeptide (TPR) repeat protein